MNRFDLLHFALHGAGDDLWLGRTALLLSTRGGAAVGRDSAADRLTVDEVGETWHLDADLVTLAACDAGAGPGSPNDGYIGLQHAFLVAGARHVLMSLRPVDDGATALLMQRFYAILLRGGGGHVEGGGVDTFREARALSEARRWLREWRAPDGTTPYAHPTYWAGFLLLSGGCPPQPAARAPAGHRLRAAVD